MNDQVPAIQYIHARRGEILQNLKDFVAIPPFYRSRSKGRYAPRRRMGSGSIARYGR